MSEPSKADKATAPAWPFNFPDMTMTMDAQMRAFMDRQGELLDETQKLMTAWTKRSQAALEEGFRTFQAACACKDPAAVAVLYGEWLKTSADRLLADLTDTRDEALRFADIGQKFVTAAFRSGVDAAAQASASPYVVTKAEERRPKEARDRGPEAPARSAAE
jgi:hypothetical protein